jgi:hypothetical protein
MHASDELITLAVRQPPDCVLVDLQLDNLKVFAHDTSLMTDYC